MLKGKNSLFNLRVLVAEPFKSRLSEQLKVTEREPRQNTFWRGFCCVYHFLLVGLKLVFLF